jgi:hypothetical protein
MSKIRIEIVVAIEDHLLMVYYSSRQCYQFSVVDEIGIVHSNEKIYYTIAAAKNEGRSAIRDMSW